MVWVAAAVLWALLVATLAYLVWTVVVRRGNRRYPAPTGQIPAGELTVQLGRAPRPVVRRLRRAATRSEVYALRRHPTDARVLISALAATPTATVIAPLIAGVRATAVPVGIVAAVAVFALVLCASLAVGIARIATLPAAWITDDQHHAVAVWTFRVEGTMVTGHTLNAWPIGGRVGTRLFDTASATLADRGYTVRANALNPALARTYIRRCGFRIDHHRLRTRMKCLGIPLIKPPTAV